MPFLHYNIFLEVSVLVNVAFGLSMASCPRALISERPPLSHYLLIFFFITHFKPFLLTSPTN